MCTKLVFRYCPYYALWLWSKYTYHITTQRLRGTIAFNNNSFQIKVIEPSVTPDIIRPIANQAIGNNTQNYCNNNNNNGQKTYWLLQYSIIAPKKYYCNNAIIQCIKYIAIFLLPLFFYMRNFTSIMCDACGWAFWSHFKMKIKMS